MVLLVVLLVLWSLCFVETFSFVETFFLVRPFPCEGLVLHDGMFPTGLWKLVYQSRLQVPESLGGEQRSSAQEELIARLEENQAESARCTGRPTSGRLALPRD